MGRHLMFESYKLVVTSSHATLLACLGTEASCQQDIPYGTSLAI
jgi:hypothetical protein